MPEDDNNYQRWEYILVPCNYLHKELGEDIGDTIDPQCIKNQTAQEDYLGNMRAIVYFTEEVFNQNQYGDASVQKRSKFIARQMDQTKPSWLDGTLQTNMLADETGFL